MKAFDRDRWYADSDGDRIVWVAVIAALVIAALVMVGW